MHHVGHLPRAGGGVALDGVGQRVHTGGGGQAFGHGVHHVRIDDGDLGDIIHVDTDELALALHVGNDIVDRDLSRGAGGGGHSDREHSMVLRRSNTFQRADVREFGIIDNDADGFRGIHDGAAANGDDAVTVKGLERLDARLHVFDGRVRLHVGEERVGNALRVQNIGNLLDLAGLHDVAAGGDERALEAASFELIANLGNGTGAVIGNGVQYNTICHDGYLFSLKVYHGLVIPYFDVQFMKYL